MVAKALQGLTGTPRAFAPGLSAGLLLLALSAAFAPQAVLAQPAKPTGLRITAVENSITLSWTAATDASITRWEYRFKNKERSERGWYPFRFKNSEASTRTATLDRTTTLHGGVGQYQVRSAIVTRQGGKDVTSVSPWSDVVEVSVINTDNLALVFGGSPVSATGTTSVSYNASVARNASVTYTVALSEAALPYIVNPVELTLTSSATTRVRVSPSTLTFTADNAQTPQTVTLTGVAAGSATIGHAARFPGLALLDPAGTIAVTVTAPVTVTLPAKPTGFDATASGTQVGLAWTDPGDASITRWQYRQKVGSGHYGTWTDVPGATATTTSHAVTGLRPGGVYTFELRAVNAGGSGPASDEATATIVPPVPAAPVRLTAIAGPRQVTLFWKNPRDATITGWQYRQKTTGNYGDWIDILDAAATSTGTRYTGTAPGLTAGTAYTFELRAVNVGGNSPASGEVSSTPTGGVPVKPTALRVVMVAEDSVTLRWTATADSSITKWSFQAGRAFADGRIDWGGNWAGRIIAITGSAASTRTHTVDTSGLVDGLQYAFRVRSTNADGDSAWSPTSRVVGIVNSDNLAMTLSARTLTVDRGDTVTYTVALTAAAMPGFWGFGQRISFTPTSSDTATATVSPPSLVFTQSTVSTTQTVTVTGVKSGRATISHSFNLLDPYRIGVASGKISVIVTDNARAAVTVDPGTLSLAEGATGVYTLVLNTQPANAVLVTVGGATAKLTVQGSPLTFSTADWASPQTVTVVAQQDADGSDERVTLTHAVSGYGPVTTAPSVVVSITDDEVTEQTPATRAERVNRAVLPHVVESITAGTLSAVTGRIDAAIAGTPAAAGNALNLAALAARYGQTHASGADIPLWEALNGTRFALPLSAAGEGGGALPNLAIWGGSNWLSLSGSQATDSTDSIAWDGGVWGTALGADLRLRPNLLAGVSISHARGSIDTTVTDGSGSIAGDYDTRTTSVYPYLAWSLSERLSLWVTGGYGKGRLEIKEADAPTRESDLDLAGGAAGGRGVLLETTDLIHGGVTRFAFTGEGAYTQVKVDGGDAAALPELEVDTHRLRLAMQGSHEHSLPDGSSLRPAIEVGMRHDGGSGDNTGFGVETGGTLSYLHPALGLTLELRGRTLLEHEADRNEWGIGGLVRIDPNTRGRGLFLSLAPSRGSTASRIAQPYQYAGHASAVGGATGGYRLDAELGHGFGLRRHGTDATLTPYVGMALAARDAHSFRLGGRYHIGAAFKLDLEALRRQHRTQRPDHSLLLRGTLHW